jgi:hypothetical protein
MEVPVVVISIQVETLEELVIPKPIPLVIPNIGINVEVILMDNVAHASKVFKIPDIVLKDTRIVEGPKLPPIPLAEPIDTIGEQLIDDLIVGIK